MPRNDSIIYGGNASNGDVVARPGSDAIIVIGGKGPDAYEVQNIRLGYSVETGADYESAGIRSFMGRLTIFQGDVTRNMPFTIAGPPNPQLVNEYSFEGLSKGDILADIVINDYTRVFDWLLPQGGSIGAIASKPGTAISIVAIAPTNYSGGGVAQSIFTTFLHVVARKIGDSALTRVGNHFAAD